MIDNAMRPPAFVAAPAPSPTASPPDRPAQTTPAHPFAELLRQNKLAAATPVPSTASSTPVENAADRPATATPSQSSDTTPTESTPQPREATLAKGRLAARTAARPAQESATATPANEAQAHPGQAKDAATATPDPALVAGALASTRPDLAPRDGGDPGDSTDEARDATTAPGNASGARAGANDSALAGAPPFDLSSPQSAATGTASGRRGVLLADDATLEHDGVDEPQTEAAAGSFVGLLSDAKTSHWQAASSSIERSDGAAAAPASGALTGSAAPDAAGGVTTPTLAVAVQSPDFAVAFGVQVSVLAKDGVQHAELHLNPAEMGPVSIRISLDGTQARVDFGADVAATRHAIEAGLPELAGALRDAGFTLAGGGVAQHSASNGGGQGDAGSGAAAASPGASTRVTELDASTQRQTRRVAAGGVDLYA